MIATRPQVPRSFAISISESPDLAFFGLGPGHLREAMAEMAIHMLAQGGDLAYGGDLRPGGFTELLFELVSRYPRPDDTGDAVRVTNYLAWPVHIQMARDALCNLEDRLRGIAEVILIGRDGKRLSMDERQALEPHVPDDRQWAAGLTGMRRSMRTGTDARIVLGGRVEDYKGCMPGIAEEVMLSPPSRPTAVSSRGFRRLRPRHRRDARARGLEGRVSVCVAASQRVRALDGCGYAERLDAGRKPYPRRHAVYGRDSGSRQTSHPPPPQRRLPSPELGRAGR